MTTELTEIIQGLRRAEEYLQAQDDMTSSALARLRIERQRLEERRNAELEDRLTEDFNQAIENGAGIEEIARAVNEANGKIQWVRKVGEEGR